ncbi:MAG: DNA-processing protein DprA [Methanobrevibacter sp.]|nr:DNA-processing protein DprA [Methanobrevibacter sp.]MDO5848508.1 DNA-processing protein DprA [Methanobrevibacter sp.]
MEDLDKALELTEDILDIIDSNPLFSAVTILDKEYPSKLKDLANKAPPILYTVGNTEILSKPNMAVIGTRKPDIDTQNFEYRFVQNLVERTERAIISGLALGCDKTAHMATVDMREDTIAVLPVGINRISQLPNSRLAQMIVENGGCLITSFKPNAGANKSSYDTRNQYVATLADGIFVAQCSSESGTMNTVDYARKRHRRIGCFMPDDVGSADFSGNELILKEYRHRSFAIKNQDDLDGFLEFLVSRPKKRDYQSTLLDFMG